MFAAACRNRWKLSIKVDNKTERCGRIRMNARLVRRVQTCALRSGTKNRRLQTPEEVLLTNSRASAGSCRRARPSLTQTRHTCTFIYAAAAELKGPVCPLAAHREANVYGARRCVQNQSVCVRASCSPIGYFSAAAASRKLMTSKASLPLAASRSEHRRGR